MISTNGTACCAAVANSSARAGRSWLSMTATTSASRSPRESSAVRTPIAAGTSQPGGPLRAQAPAVPLTTWASGAKSPAISAGTPDAGTGGRGAAPRTGPARGGRKPAPAS
ncbi:MULTISPECIES: hypothetical protein [unclassified Streptomyces]|uniref:hypothetical protein n=1 Tax=unclassified Streptomyces TaxID=2593676 RepID=UPI001EFDE7D8|nr:MULTISPECIES: hypothetical protein [unclassified Streptomyces]